VLKRLFQWKERQKVEQRLEQSTQGNRSRSGGDSRNALHLEGSAGFGQNQENACDDVEKRKSRTEGFWPKRGRGREKGHKRRAQAKKEFTGCSMSSREIKARHVYGRILEG